jgi:hypothetical protein
MCNGPARCLKRPNDNLLIRVFGDTVRSSCPILGKQILWSVFFDVDDLSTSGKPRRSRRGGTRHGPNLRHSRLSAYSPLRTELYSVLSPFSRPFLSILLRLQLHAAERDQGSRYISAGNVGLYEQ